ncbi:MAG: chitobiase/beta-hexosaminidase C-terminal domain-containing protein [Spirochaetales bacterium]|nr:chitobiase/beta-hexosaminidase C-terminal domain-containing protein [Spirochaetales bacterium]
MAGVCNDKRPWNYTRRSRPPTAGLDGRYLRQRIDGGGWYEIIVVGCGLFTPPLQVAAPTFTPRTGTYQTVQHVTISSATGGASIRYTTDGTLPTAEKGKLYSGPVSIATTTTVKAIAFKGGMDGLGGSERGLHDQPACGHQRFDGGDGRGDRGEPAGGEAGGAGGGVGRAGAAHGYLLR